MILSTQKYQNNSRNSKPLIQQIIHQLPVLRFSLYVIIPLVLMEEIPKYAEHLSPVSNEEKIATIFLLISSFTTLSYLFVRKLFYNLNKYWTFGGMTLISGSFVLSANLFMLPFDQISLIVGFSIAANLSHEVARFDTLQYQREKGRKINYSQYPNIEFNYKIARNGLIRLKFYGYSIIPIRNVTFSKKQTLSGYLKTKEMDFIEREKDVIVNYHLKIEGWFFFYYSLKNNLLKSYVNFLTGLNDLMK